MEEVLCAQGNKKTKQTNKAANSIKKFHKSMGSFWDHEKNSEKKRLCVSVYASEYNLL